MLRIQSKNQKVALASIALWFTSKEQPLHFTSQTILFKRAEVATSKEDLAMNFEFAISAESKSELF